MKHTSDHPRITLASIWFAESIEIQLVGEMLQGVHAGCTKRCSGFVRSVGMSGHCCHEFPELFVLRVHSGLQCDLRMSVASLDYRQGPCTHNTWELSCPSGCWYVMPAFSYVLLFLPGLSQMFAAQAFVSVYFCVCVISVCFCFHVIWFLCASSTIARTTLASKPTPLPAVPVRQHI